MLKNFLFSLLAIVILTCFYFSTDTLANTNYDIIKVENKVRVKLTEEQKELLIKKKEELKNKFLDNLENKTEEEKKEAIKKYKEEMRKYIKEEFGVELHKKKKNHVKDFLEDFFSG